MVEIDKIFNQPEMNFVLLPKGRKSPPIEKELAEQNTPTMMRRMSMSKADVR